MKMLKEQSKQKDFDIIKYIFLNLQHWQIVLGNYFRHLPYVSQTYETVFKFRLGIQSTSLQLIIQLQDALTI